MEKYLQTKKILADDVNMFRKLRLSTFMRWLQEISIAHTEELGQGRKKTLDKGALWILARVKIEFFRIPNYDEVVDFFSWPSETMRVLFPRNYLLKSKSGETLIKSSAVWLLMDENSRKMVFPDSLGVEINGFSTGEEIEIPKGIMEVNEFDFEKNSIEKIAFRDIDINCHLNSSRYLDFFDNTLGKNYLEKNQLKSLKIDYLSEAKLNDELKIVTKYIDNMVFQMGSINEKPTYKIKAIFKN